jgi:hypothetical protein
MSLARKREDKNTFKWQLNILLHNVEIEFDQDKNYIQSVINDILIERGYIIKEINK